MKDDRTSTGRSSSGLVDQSAASTGSGRIPKLCCVCGEDLVGKQRFKDHDGRYWCPACAREDTIRKQPAVCPDCRKQLTRGDMVAYEGSQLCKGCAEKRHLSAKRAAARIAAAELAGEKQHERRRMLTIAVVTALIVVVGFVAAWLCMM